MALARDDERAFGHDQLECELDFSVSNRVVKRSITKAVRSRLSGGLVSTQELDVKKSWRAVHRHRKIVLAAALVGLLGGVAAGLFAPPMQSATSLVVLPPPPVTDLEDAVGTHSIETQVLVAKSGPVLSSAGRNMDPPLTLDQTRDRVSVRAVTEDVLEVKARGTSGEDAIRLANAVTEIYFVYAATENRDGNGAVRSGARVLESATTAQGGNIARHLAIRGSLGAVAGALLASLAILAIARGDRRLRLRDELANTIGAPVLASASSYRPRSARDWANLFEYYEPTSVDAWGFRKALYQLGIDAQPGGVVSLTVISFAEDDKAIPLGPQLAAFATSIGIPTTLTVDTHNEHTEALLAAHPPAFMAQESSSHVLGNGSNGSGDRNRQVGLHIGLLVVDRTEPQLAGVGQSAATLVAISSGAVTAEELARLAVAAASDGRTIDGLIVADPEPTDHTTGRVAPAMRRSKLRRPAVIVDAKRRTAP